jgi:hypothetical protein
MTDTVDVCASPVLEIGGSVIEFEQSRFVTVSGAARPDGIGPADER